MSEGAHDRQDAHGVFNHWMNLEMITCYGFDVPNFIPIFNVYSLKKQNASANANASVVYVENAVI